MIKGIRIEGFKSLKKVELSLGNLNLFIGANASGKSNFFDALRVLQGIGYGFTIDEIFNGKPKSATSEVWEGIRGGSGRADFINRQRLVNIGRPEELVPSYQTMRFKINLVDNRWTIAYTIQISAHYGTVVDEKLIVEDRVVYDASQSDDKRSNYGDSPFITVQYHLDGHTETLKFQNRAPLLHQLLRHPESIAADREVLEACIHALSDVQRLDPLPATLREYSRPFHAARLGERGENFAAVAKGILGDATVKSAYLSWLQHLTPLEFDDVRILEGATGDAVFAVVEHGATYDARVLSDGTLRFAAIVAAFFQPDMPGTITIEEIENGFHPSRLRLLVELLKARATGNQQVLITSHSPTLLSWLTKEDYDTTFLCRRNEETGATEITPLSKIPRFMELVHTQSVGDLFTEGWLEVAA